MIDSLLTVPEAARIAKVSTRTFFKLIATGRAPEVIKIGRASRIRASDADLWIRLGCCTRDELEAAKATNTPAKATADGREWRNGADR